MAESSLKYLNVYIAMKPVPSEQTARPALFVTEKLVPEGESANGDLHFFFDNSLSSPYSGVRHRSSKEHYKYSELIQIGNIPLEKYHDKYDGWLHDLPERDWEGQPRHGSLLDESYVRKVLDMLKKSQILRHICGKGRAWIRGNLVG
ncbi:hypothetical protein N7530_006095 [Penicillium desertorum]|uniref:Uncharacterized protein n=1 Tax=Penicillium desertorum TaxID=1303715 RepID=A0A9W9X2H1_9EURO|nr:hypothetical protein N7530_006095 [Penicillium desertorum]